MEFKRRSHEAACKPLGNRVTICQERRDARLIYAEVLEEGVGQDESRRRRDRRAGCRAKKSRSSGMPTRKRARHESHIAGPQSVPALCPVRAQEGAMARRGERQAGAIRARPRHDPANHKLIFGPRDRADEVSDFCGAPVMQSPKRRNAPIWHRTSSTVVRAFQTPSTVD